jgi:O-antigen ligase
MLGSVLAVLILNNVETIIVQGLGKDMAFNGRQEIWDLAIERGLERPWLGYGYFGFWGSDAGYYIVLNTWGSLQAHDSSFRFNSHNGFIDLFLQLGWVGLSMFIVGYLTLFIRVAIQFYSTGSLESFWMLLTILPELLFNLSDSTSILSSHALWILYVSIGFSTLIQGNRIRKKSQASAALNST